MTSPLLPPLALLAWAWACAPTIDLTGHACPCLDGFACVNDVCVDADQNEGEGEGEGGAEGEGEAGPECDPGFFSGDACEAPLSGDLTVVSACADDNTRTEELDEGILQCDADAMQRRFVSIAVTGGLRFAGDDVSSTVTGSTTWDITTPNRCGADDCPTLAAAWNSSVFALAAFDVTCAAAGDGCACDVSYPYDRVLTGPVSQQAGLLTVTTADAAHTFITCGADGAIVRESTGGRLGPTLIFARSP